MRRLLRQAPTVGEGPYPEQGVRWEAGMYAAYFSDYPMQLCVGTPSDTKYSSPLSKLQAVYPDRTAKSIADPGKGVVGAILLRVSRTAVD